MLERPYTNQEIAKLLIEFLGGRSSNGQVLDGVVAEISQAGEKIPTETVWTDPQTRKVYRVVDAAFDPRLAAADISSRGSLVSTPKGNGIKK